MEQLGIAVLELRTDQVPLNKGLDSAEARTKRATDVMQRSIDATIARWAALGAAADAAAAEQIAKANEVTAALARQAAAADLVGEKLEANAAKAQLGARSGSPVGRAAPGRDIESELDRLVESMERPAPGSGTPSAHGDTGGVWGVRGPRGGTLQNPVVVVLEAGKYAPMGSWAAALGDSNMADQQGNNSPVASAIDLQALSDQVSELARNLQPADRLASAGAGNIGASTIPAPGAPQTTVQDPESALLLSQLVQTMHDLKDGVQNHPLVAAGRGPAGPRGPLVTALVPADVASGSPPSYEQALARQSAADAAAAKARAGYERTIRPSSNATPGEQAAALAQREAAVAEAVAARAQTRAAEAEITAAAGGSHGGGGSGSGRGGILGGALAGRGGGGGGRNLLATILKGDGGKGGTFGLPTFGSVGSLAGFGLEHWLLSALGIGASATSAVAGAGLLGASSLTQGLVGGGADALVSKDTIDQAQALNTNVQALNKAVAVYGANSKQAAAAQYDLNQQWKALGGGAGKQAIQQLDTNAQAVKKLFDQTSGAAREAAAGVDEEVLGLAKTYVPFVTQSAQRNLTLISTGLRPLFSWLEGPQGMGIIQELENAFARDLPTTIHALDMGVEDFLRLMAAASSSTRGLSRDLDNLFTRKNQESTAQYSAEVQKLVGDLHLWDAFLKVLGEDMVAIFRQDAGTAPSIIEELTGQLQRLHEWETSAGGQSQLSHLFAVHKQEILQLLQLLPELGSGFGQFYLTVAPPLVSAVTGIAHAFAGLLGAIDALGPGARDLLGLTLVLGKLGLLAPVLRTFGSALGFDTGQEAANVPAATADAAATRLVVDADTKLLVEAPGLASRLAPTSMMAVLRAKGAGLGGASEAEIAAATAKGGEALTGTAAFGAAALPALAAGAGGIFAGSIAQSALGLREGTSGTVGGGIVGAGLGAALSTVIGPLGPVLGTALGAGIGSTLGPSVEHLLGSIFGGGEDHGKKFAAGFGSAFDAYIPHAIEQSLQKALADATDKARAIVKLAAHAGEIPYGAANAQGVHATRGGGVPGANLPAAAIAAWKQQGVAAAKLFDAGYTTVRRPSEYGFATDAIAQLQKLKPAARASAAATMLAYAQTLVAKKELPRSAISGIIAAMEGEFPGLTSYLRAQGEGTDKALAAAYQLKSAKTSLTSSLSTFRQEFGIYSVDKDVTGANLAATTQTEMQFLTILWKKGVAGAGEALQQLKQQTATTFDAMAAKTSAQMAVLTHAIVSGSAEAAQQGSQAIFSFATAVDNAVGNSTLAASKGSQLIAQALNQALKAFGLKQIPITVLQGMSPSELLSETQFLTQGQASGQISGPGHHATGAKVTTPMYMVGEEAPGHPEYVLATNPAYRDRNLGLWAAAGHDLGIPGFAAGGIVGYGQLEGLWDQAGGAKNMAALMAAIAEAESTGNPLAHNASGASGLWQILGQPFAGNVYDPLTNARMAVAKYLSQGLGAWTTYTSGAYRQFLHGNVPAIAGGGGGAVPDIKAPHVAGAGTMADLVRGMLGMDAAAANRYLQAHAPGPGGGGAGMPGTVLAHGGKPAQLEQAAMAAAHQILGLPYTWGGGHGGFFGDPGFDCSGAVSYILHAMGLLASPETTSGLASWGLPGPGKYISVGVLPGAAHAAHTMMSFFGHFLESGGHTTAGPHWDSGWSQNFPIMRHPPGLASGGMVGDFGEQSAASLLGGVPELINYPPFRAYAAAQGYPLPALKDANTGRPIPASFLADTKKKAPAKKSKPKGLGEVGMFGPLGGPNADLGPIGAGLKLAMGLDGLSVGGNAGANRIGDLNELISYKEGLWGLDPLNYASAPSDFVISTDPLTGQSIAPYIDESALSKALAELQQLYGWQSEIVADLQRVQAISYQLTPAIQAAIARRKAQIEQLKERIRANIKKIDALRKSIAAAQAHGKPNKAKISSWHSAIAAEQAKKHPDKAKISGLYNLISAEYAKSANAGQIKGWQKEIAPLEAENRKLGGAASTIGTGGQLGSAQRELTTLQADLSAVKSWPYTISGGTGLGGDLGPAILAQDSTWQSIEQLKPGASTALTVAASSGSGATNQAAMIALLQQQVALGVEQNAIEKDQYAALSTLPLPPYGGSFATGGMVPGPVGAARTVIAHGGEVIGQPGGGGDISFVQHFGSGMEWLQALIRTEIQKDGRTVARKVGRKMPSRGGGLLVAG